MGFKEDLQKVLEGYKKRILLEWDDNYLTSITNNDWGLAGDVLDELVKLGYDPSIIPRQLTGLRMENTEVTELYGLYNPATKLFLVRETSSLRS
jgi:hypothetical protein